RRSAPGEPVAGEMTRKPGWQASRSTRAQGAFSMRADSSGRKRFRLLVHAALTLIFTAALGCGRSRDVVEGELPEAARKFLVQKKADVQNRSAGKSRVGN